ncbi:hypothetical protein E6C27_scaffold271G002080 [Cucumis melo var. makuwa]|uniref:Uncharacterized protein n=1 Tax=Cucumis melo var. makuwa TaxID=1194695 RepID=A0A5A7VFJ7_CUCMM|nr:hypothetical protein E6C27_scaffold271G002080 [Cucumis melo var. makuwa]
MPLTPGTAIGITTDRNRTVLRRSKPNSRTTFIGEQPNPWDLLQPQDVMVDIEVPNDFVNKTLGSHQLVIPDPLVLRIFTENSISPSPCRRQRGNRDTIHVGRYLCDKEFCYLRTVRVTAAIYRGFHSKLITLLFLTFQHRAGVRLYTSCYHLADSCVFNRQSLPPGMCRFPKKKIGEHPFSRSYGVILPSSFDMVLSSALVYFTCSPVSVWDSRLWRYALSRPLLKGEHWNEKGCRLVRLNETFENESAHSQVLRKVSVGLVTKNLPRLTERPATDTSKSCFQGLVASVNHLSPETFLACIQSFPGVGKAKWDHPIPLSALPQAIDIIHSTEIDFAKNQLYPILVGLSPLATSHPRSLPHTWVRSSKASPTPNGLSRSSHFLATHHAKGFFSPFPHSTCTLSVIEEYLGLEGGPPFSRKSDQNSNTPRLTGKD